MEIVTETEGKVVVVTPKLEEGENPHEASVSKVRGEISRIVRAGGRKVVLDLREVDFMVSTDIATLVGSARELHLNKGLFMLCGLGLRLAETLAVVQLLRVLPIRFTRNEAVMALTKTQIAKESTSALLSENPTIEKIREWWDHVVQAQTREVRIDPSVTSTAADPEPELVDEESRIQPGTAIHAPLQEGNGSDPVEKAIQGLRPDLHDWVAGLETLRTAKALFARHGLKFTPDLTFKDFLARLSESLMEK